MTELIKYLVQMFAFSHTELHNDKVPPDLAPTSNNEVVKQRFPFSTEMKSLKIKAIACIKAHIQEIE